jgi:protein-L-isoaspartate(D-aspartate) O-methyltransferase
MEKLIADIEQDTVHTAFMTGIKHIDAAVLSAIKNTDRKAFVRPQDQNFAYVDRPLEIGFNQTISQPFMVALITQLIEPKPQDKVLEVGSGSGYQVAILSKLCKEVLGLEIIPELAERSRQILKELHINNVTIVCSDGNLGLPTHAPFDKIIISAAANKLPDFLLDQLAVGGIMVLPKTISPFEQMLTRIKKVAACEFKMNDILPVRFVPLVNS